MGADFIVLVDVVLKSVPRCLMISRVPFDDLEVAHEALKAFGFDCPDQSSKGVLV